MTKTTNPKKAQYITIFIAWVAYVAVYFGRYSYSANITLIEDFYAKSHAEAGLVMTLFSAAYGIGQIFHGLFCKRYPKRWVIPISLTVSAVMDLLVFSGIPFGWIKYLWFTAAVFQSALWPTIMQVISENVEEKLLRTAIMVMSTTTSCGTLLVYGLSAAMAGVDFHLTFLIGTFVLLGAGLLWLLLYRKGHELEKAAEKAARTSAKPGEEAAEQTAAPAPKTSKRAIGIGVIITISLLVFCSVMVNFGKDGLQTWVPVILKKVHGMPDSYSILLTLVLPLFGIFGAAGSVQLNKKIKSPVVLTLVFLGVIAVFDFIVVVSYRNLPVMLAAFASLEFLLHGCCNVITGIFPLSMREKMSTGMLTGILNGSGYAGTAAASYVLGKIADVTGGWTWVFVTLLGTAVTALILGVIYLIFSRKPGKQNNEVTV